MIGSDPGEMSSAGQSLSEAARDIGALVEHLPVGGHLPLGDETVLVVVGSENWEAYDRSLGRGHIRCVQLMTRELTVHVPQFDRLGAHGLRDIVVLPGGERVALSTGDEIVDVDLRDGRLAVWPLADIGDVHQLTVIDDRVVVANTRHDEIVVASTSGRLLQRRSLASFRHRRSRAIHHDRPLGGLFPRADTGHDDHFHVNEAFTGHDDHLCVLVHYIDGFRPTRSLARLLLGHGAGGVIDLDDGGVHPLALHAPHSARWTGSNYVVLNSGRHELVVYQPNWVPFVRLPVDGWGRGLDVDVQRERMFLATSAIRSRYITELAQGSGNAVVAIDTRLWKLVGERPVSGVEQIWAVRLIPLAVAESLLKLDTDAR